MNKLNQYFACLLVSLMIIGILGCAGGPQGKLPRIESPTASELRQDWKNYTVYYRRNIALVYKLKDEQKIVLDERWQAVTSASMMEKSKITSPTWVKQITDQNGGGYGYLVHRSADRANVAIIDGNTVQLYYHYVRTSGGP